MSISCSNFFLQAEKNHKNEPIAAEAAAASRSKLPAVWRSIGGGGTLSGLRCHICTRSPHFASFQRYNKQALLANGGHSSLLFFDRTAQCQFKHSIQYWAARRGRARMGFNKAGNVFAPGWRMVRRHQAISFAHHVQLGLALSKEASVANWSRIDIEEVHASSMRRGKQAWVDVNSFWLVWNWSCEAPAYHSG